MRIIAGRFGGRTLKSPQGHMTRPSTARTRESLFSLIDSRIYLDGAEVLDLFAGTGALGLEAFRAMPSTTLSVTTDRHSTSSWLIHRTSWRPWSACPT